MGQYKCVKRLTTDGGKTVHEVGETVELTGNDEKVALRAQAVVAIKAPRNAPTETPKAEAQKGDA
ncbi:hypothetical protein [Alicyclobacillus sp. ALC3]|uniref:hypothetical protein n=1 Tax=Alicyclobacillus sp. ALC3 TaxID=2796143 RepID=UPI0023786C4B|nr:hypothetical protein [Alicyclobacillus sp. ALC3]WDL96404.1 hypothetical protein JC200_19075 [Alicyclobacillus sp. ALC3]